MIIKVDVNDFKVDLLGKIPRVVRPQGNQGTYNRDRYLRRVCTFDIETSKIETCRKKVNSYVGKTKIEKEVVHYDAFMYRWKFFISDFCKGELVGDGIVITGCYWEEFLDLLNKLSENMVKDDYYCVYVHNLAHEFQFMSGIYDFQPEEVFATDKRKILKCKMLNHFEFRCSYQLAGKSLDSWTHEWNVPHAKTHDLDYSVLRFPWTKLSDIEDNYCDCDVIGLAEALVKQLHFRGDTFHTTPMTKTGYPRRDAKRAINSIPNFSASKINPNYEVYEILEKAFSGGDTHANRYYVGQVLTITGERKYIFSFDFASAYPAVQITCKFPMSNFEPVLIDSIDTAFDLYTKYNRAILTGIKLAGVKLHDVMNGFPPISYSKCQACVNPLTDNGRIIEADYLEMYVTDIDLFRIIKNYDYDQIDFFSSYVSTYGELPSALKNVIMEYYRKKTELKDVEGSEIDYMLAKGDLNSIFGMTVQKMVREMFIFVNGEYVLADQDDTEQYEKTKRKAFLAYQWGVWTTAHCRARLEILRDFIRENGGVCVYCDTDSVKGFSSVKIDIEKFNKFYKDLADDFSAYAFDKNGKKRYLGIAEEEDAMTEFRTWGAKRYACTELKKGTPTLKVTVSGVNKKKGAIELQNLGGIEAFTSDLVFRDGGGTTVIYNDAPTIPEYTDPETGRTVKITRNCCIVDKEYSMSLESKYEELLQNIEKKRGYIY